MTAASVAGGWAEGGNDDRVRLEPAVGLAIVADASGPRYGGYHAPFGIDLALDAFVRAFLAGGLRPGLEAADHHLRGLASTFDLELERVKQSERNPLSASAKTADLVRPPHWQHLRGRSLAHFAASVTACAFAGNTLTLVQAGACRAWRRRDAAIELLLNDHTLQSVMLARGEADVSAPHLRDVCTSLLGVGPLTIDETSCSVSAGDRVLLCTPGVWTHDDGTRLVHTLFDAEGEAFEALLRSAASHWRVDATAVLLAFSEA